ncbi:sulfate adenylyltransferase, partial [Actinosynnema sp. NPDC050436]
PLTPGARVLVKHGTRTVQAVVTELRTRFDEQNLSLVRDPMWLRINEIGVVGVRTGEPLPVGDYTDDRCAGAFLVIDPSAGDTLGAGLVGRGPLLDGYERR